MSVPSIKLSVTVTDGSYESSISVPIDAPKGRFEELAVCWLDMMSKALTFVEPGRERKQRQGEQP